MSMGTAKFSLPAAATKLAQMISLLDELHEVVGAENRLLATGLPASLAQTVARKTELANQLDGWLDVMRRGELVDEVSGPEDLALLISKLHSLRALMGENTVRIKRSMEATRHRIDGIMRALRSDSRSTGYGADSLMKRPANEAAPSRLA